MVFYVALLGFLASIFLSVLLRKFYFHFRYLQVIGAWLNTLAGAFILAYLFDLLFETSHFCIELSMGFFTAIILYSFFVRFYVSMISSRFSRRFPIRRQTPNSWKIGSYFSDLKKRIEDSGFKKISSSKTIDENYTLILAYTTYFLSNDNTILLSVEFTLPESTNEMASHIVSKVRLKDSSEFYIITRNANRPIGLFAPENYRYVNYPMCADIFKILSIHKKRIEMLDAEPIAIDYDVLDFVRSLENDWQKANLEYGILNTQNDISEKGILSCEGKYRLWIEILLLTYFGYAPKC